jgi:hypothetical protein
VTFSNDGRHFYATLGTAVQTYLIRGDLTRRRPSVIASNVECPSLSPDNTDIAFKQRVPGSGATWRLSVIDLVTGKAHHLAETCRVDDQVEWLNGTAITYGVLADPSIAALNPLRAATPSMANGALWSRTPGAFRPTAAARLRSSTAARGRRSSPTDRSGRNAAGLSGHVRSKCTAPSRRPKRG